MRKLVVVGLLLAMSTGCGRSWMPNFLRGARCGGDLCSAPAPMPMGGCDGCGSTQSGYESYGDVGTVIDGGFSGGVPVGGSYIGGTPSYESVAPPMSPLPGAAVAPSMAPRP